MPAPSQYQVRLSSFEGPFDLLLHLIARRELDVHEIALAEITDDYLAVLAAEEVLDLDVTTEFLVVAATLVELKAARLLPGTAGDDLDELALEARDLLYARLLDYRTFKEAAEELRVRLDATAEMVGRAVGPEDVGDVRPPLELTLDPVALARIAARALADRPPVEVALDHVSRSLLTVREAAGMVTSGLRRAGGRAGFAQLTSGCRDVVEVVVHLLALLELYKLGVVELEQPSSHGDIDVAVAAGADLGRATLAIAEMAPAAGPGQDEAGDGGAEPRPGGRALAEATA
jgi:segregation and condensation protein A